MEYKGQIKNMKKKRLHPRKRLKLAPKVLSQQSGVQDNTHKKTLLLYKFVFAHKDRVVHNNILSEFGHTNTNIPCSSEDKSRFPVSRDHKLRNLASVEMQI